MSSESPFPHCRRADWRPPSAQLGFCVLLWVIAIGGSIAAEPSGGIDFTREVRPILSNHCWNCHGPDAKARKAGLRLDERDAAVREAESGSIAIVPGKPQASELIARINSADESIAMPPKEVQKPLSEAQKKVLERWIANGAHFSTHWAFTPPQRTNLPSVKQSSWASSPIDYFVLQRLEQAGLLPSAEADRATWLRRATLDLTGLPPTPIELDAFLADASASAYEAVVDRLLATPRHAERMAMHWLDAARYADTNGYNNDETRSMWPWRDWVIASFQEGMPYDRFLMEQVAGDLWPDAKLSQKIATGFNRNHVLTTEGGIIEEEYRVEYVADRVHTTATVFLGLSFQCARCHDHKYDPLSQREYYRFAAFFNNIPDKVVGYSEGRMAEPLLKVPSPAQQAEQSRLETARDEVSRKLKERADAVETDIAAWEQSLTPAELAKSVPAGLVAHFSLDEANGNQVVDAADPARRGTIQGTVSPGPGKRGGSLQFDGKTFVDAGEVAVFESDQKFSFAAWVQPSSNDPSTVLSKIDEDNAYRGYDLILEGGKVASHFVHHWPDKAFKVMTKEPVKLNEWHHIAVTYDGSRKAGGIKVYVNGKPQSVDVATGNTVDGTLKTDKPFHIGQRHSSATFQGRIDDVQVFAVELPEGDVAKLASDQSLASLKEILAVPANKRNADQRGQIRQYFLDQVDPQTRELKNELADTSRRLVELDKAIPVTMVMSEMEPRRPTHILKRGQYDQLGDVVDPGVPAAVSTFSSRAVSDRMQLARWLTDPSHPLTARVAVNRWWEMLFGIGLVETAEDFGVQGSPPSHPELLDWLATELIRRGWDLRTMLKMMVLSATYRQSSHVTPQLLNRDPNNRLLARGPRYRLPAETVRDSALAISSLLRDRVGGPSARPYQPEGLWEDVSVERREKYVPDAGEGLYRRSMYTFWKRTCPPPAMSAFDAPDRETCVIRRARTNTPLQALVLLNDPTYVEAARLFAERILKEAATDDERLTMAVKVALSRAIRGDERPVLIDVLQAARQRFLDQPNDAEKLLSVGHSPRDTAFAAAELAAWTTVTSMLLNLDETISKR